MYQTPQNPIQPGSYTTTSTGTPVASDDHSLTVGADGPIVLHDAYTVEKLAQFNRERVPGACGAREGNRRIRLL